MSIAVLGFEEILWEYAKDKDFKQFYAVILNGEHVRHLNFSIHDGYLFRGV